MSETPCTHCNGSKKIPMFLPGSWADCDWCAVLEATPEPEASDEEDAFRVIIDDVEMAVSHWTNLSNGGWQLDTDHGEFIMFEDAEEAGKAARAYWADMAANDPSEFACMVGQDTLVAWGMGQYAGPGSTQVRSMSDWLDLWLNTPEEHFASYDGEECNIEHASPDIVEELGFTPTVAYRHN